MDSLAGELMAFCVFQWFGFNRILVCFRQILRGPAELRSLTIPNDTQPVSLFSHKNFVLKPLLGFGTTEFVAQKNEFGF